MNQNIKFYIIYYTNLILFLHENPTSEITPSLTALDDAQALRQREWISEPGEDVP